jgi:hypothetical protein
MVAGKGGEPGLCGVGLGVAACEDIGGGGFVVVVWRTNILLIWLEERKARGGGSEGANKGISRQWLAGRLALRIHKRTRCRETRESKGWSCQPANRALFLMKSLKPKPKLRSEGKLLLSSACSGISQELHNLHNPMLLITGRHN